MVVELSQEASNLIKEFQDYLLVDRGLSKNSIFSYTYDLKKFQHFLESNEKEFLQVDPDDISQFLREQSRKEISSRSIARAVAALRQFYKFLQQNRQIQANPVERIKPPEIKKNLPDYLTLDEMNELFASIREDDIYELRDKAIFELLYSSGLRISEACNLLMSNIDFKNMYVNVKGKGGRERLVPFGQQSYNVLIKYLRDSRKNILRERSSDYLFISKKSEHLNRKSVWRLLKKYIGRTSIIKVVTPHTFRHSFATHLIESDADLRSVQELLGHIDISTTQIYTHLAGRSLKKVHKKYHPRS